MNRQHASLTSPSNRVSKRNPKGSASRLTRGLDIDMAAGNNQPVESGIVPGKSDSLRFFNDVSGDQLNQVAAKLEADKAKPNADPNKPAIDADMF